MTLFYDPTAPGFVIVYKVIDDWHADYVFGFQNVKKEAKRIFCAHEYVFRVFFFAADRMRFRGVFHRNRFFQDGTGLEVFKDVEPKHEDEED